MSQAEPRKEHVRSEYLTEVRKIISEWIARNAFKNSLISITKCELSDYGGRITVYVSVYPAHGLQGALSFLTRHAREIADHLQTQHRHRRKPFLIFEADVSN